jgi:hypothetical protein
VIELQQAIPGSSENPKTLQPGAVFEAARKQAVSRRDVEAKRKNGLGQRALRSLLFASTSLCESSLPDDTTAYFPDFQADRVKIHHRGTKARRSKQRRGTPFFLLRAFVPLW